MLVKEVGGISISNINLSAATTVTQLLGQGPYSYELLSMLANDTWHKNGTKRYCIYVLEADSPAFVNGIKVTVDNYVLGEADQLEIFAGKGRRRILVACQSIESCSESLKLCYVNSAKKVEKPWGYEIWLTGDPSPVFAFKKILLRAGNQTSLQYHRQKRETNLIVHGDAELYYCPRNDVPAERVRTDMIESIRLHGPFVADVFPGSVHRLAAHTDLTLMEVSTPELDDVVRIHDDTGRTHGRISHEHR